MKDMEAFIHSCFWHNFELLRQEGGHSLSPETRDVALNQVLIYWRRLREVAERITDTEVPIHLPNQITPKGRVFGIEGVVDVIREDDLTIMYDIKTHDPDYVRDHSEVYAMQLNLYAYVWQQLRNEPLDMLAIIATAYDKAIRDVIPPGKLVSDLTDDELVELDTVLERWQPLVELEYNHLDVVETIRQFGEVVDKIEDGVFSPPSIEILETKWQQTNERFATRICRNCDARFSCDSYRSFATRNQRGNWRLADFVETFFGDLGEAAQQEGWIASNLNATPEEVFINALLGE